MDLCSVSAFSKDVHCGVVKPAFLMIVEPANPVATMEVDTDVGGTNEEDASIRNGPSCWD